MYVELEESNFANWNRYKEILGSIRIVRPSKLWPTYYGCNCKIGIKKKLCKHAVMIMCRESMLDYPPDAYNSPLEKKRKIGRPKKAAGALSREI